MTRLTLEDNIKRDKKEIQYKVLNLYPVDEDKSKF
jgi:hypothetical protein